MRKLEAQGVESRQAQAITEAMMEVLNDSMENVSGSYVSKSEMQKVSRVSNFRGFMIVIEEGISYC